MSRTTKTIVLIAGFLIAASCSNITVRRVKLGDYDTPGIRIWRPAPYVLVRAPIEVSRVTRIWWAPLPGSQMTEICEDPCPHPLPAHPPAGGRQPAPAVGGVPASPDGGVPDMARQAPAADEESSPPSREVSQDDVSFNGVLLAAAGDAIPARKKGKGNDSAKDNPDGGAPDGGDSSAADDQKGGGTTSTVDTSNLSIVWLPDYCEDYAIEQSNVLSSQQLKLPLTDGWQLTNYESQMDSTQVVGKLIDAVASVASSVVGATTGGGAGGAAKSAAAASDKASKAESGTNQYFRTIDTWVIEPGVYPLFKKRDDCTKAPEFDALVLTRHLKNTHEVHRFNPFGTEKKVSAAQSGNTDDQTKKTPPAKAEGKKERPVPAAKKGKKAEQPKPQGNNPPEAKPAPNPKAETKQ